MEDIYNVKYTYCSVPAFMSILRNQKIFASDPTKMNDGNELHEAVRFIINALMCDLHPDNRPAKLKNHPSLNFEKVKARLTDNVELLPGWTEGDIKTIDEERLINYLECVDRAIDRLPNNNVFIACFSAQKDLLSQWCKYGAQCTGVALGIDLTTLQDDVKKKYDCIIQNVIYLDVAPATPYCIPPVEKPGQPGEVSEHLEKVFDQCIKILIEVLRAGEYIPGPSESDAVVLSDSTLCMDIQREQEFNCTFSFQNVRARRNVPTRSSLEPCLVFGDENPTRTSDEHQIIWASGRKAFLTGKMEDSKKKLGVGVIITPNIIKELLVFKHEGWKEEQETRLIFILNDIHNFMHTKMRLSKLYNKDCLVPYIEISFDIKCIDEIVTGPACILEPRDLEQLIVQSLYHYYHNKLLANDAKLLADNAKLKKFILSLTQEYLRLLANDQKLESEEIVQSLTQEYDRLLADDSKPKDKREGEILGFHVNHFEDKIEVYMEEILGKLDGKVFTYPNRHEFKVSKSSVNFR